MISLADEIDSVEVSADIPNSTKVLSSVGKGLQAAGGPVTTERAANAIRLGVTSIICGGEVQRKAQNELSRSNVVLTENDLLNLESDQNKLTR